MVRVLKFLLMSIFAVLAVTGCSSKNGNADLLAQKNQEIDRLTQELTAARKSVEPVGKKSEIKDENAVSNSLVPPNAKPGECYAKVLVPTVYESKLVKRLSQEAKAEVKVTQATYRVEEKRITIREAGIKLVTVPATYKTVSEKIMVKPEKRELIVIPATYKTVSEKIMVKPEKRELIVIPATYKTVSENVLVSPSHTVWKKGRGEIERVDHATGDIMCLVEVPAVYRTVVRKELNVDAYTKEVITPATYKTVTKKVVDSPASTKERVVSAAVYEKLTRQAIDVPATTKEVKIPAICKMVKIKVIDTPAKEHKVEVPAVYETYTKKTKVSEPYLRWQSILCETNTDANVVSNLQKELQERGYKVRYIDGIYGPETKAAVNAYQKDNKLSQGALTIKTLQLLGLK